MSRLYPLFFTAILAALAMGCGGSGTDASWNSVADSAEGTLAGSGTDGPGGTSDDDGTDAGDPLLVSIVTPDDGDKFLLDATVEFECAARHASGKAVDSPSFSWDIQPADMTLFGSRVATVVPAGVQTVTCEVVDDATGQLGSDVITVEIASAIVEISQPHDGARYPETFEGSQQSEQLDFVARGQGSDGAVGAYTWTIGTSTLLGAEVSTAAPLGVQAALVTFEDPAGNTATDEIQFEVLSLAAWEACEEAEEVCNGVDDDCDGEVDEGEMSCGVGQCRVEVDKCVEGKDNVCIPGSPSPERCNGVDDDCDGLVDEQDLDGGGICGGGGSGGNNNRICQEGECVDFTQTTACDQCPCSACENRFDLEMCCELPAGGVICVDADAEDSCPVF